MRGIPRRVPRAPGGAGGVEPVHEHAEVVRQGERRRARHRRAAVVAQPSHRSVDERGRHRGIVDRVVEPEPAVGVASRGDVGRHSAGDGPAPTGEEVLAVAGVEEPVVGIEPAPFVRPEGR